MLTIQTLNNIVYSDLNDILARDIPFPGSYEGNEYRGRALFKSLEVTIENLGGVYECRLVIRAFNGIVTKGEKSFDRFTDAKKHYKSLCGEMAQLINSDHYINSLG
jgi:hypothetical protein